MVIVKYSMKSSPFLRKRQYKQVEICETLNPDSQILNKSKIPNSNTKTFYFGFWSLDERN